MASLYKINGELLQLVNQIEEQGGEVTQEQETSLQINREQLSEKVVAYDYVIKMLNADMGLAISEIKRIEEYIEKKRKAIESLQKFLLQSVLLFGQEQSNGVKKLEFGTVTLSTRKNPKSVEHLDDVEEKYRMYDVKLSNLTLEEKDTILKTTRAYGTAPKVESKISKTLIKQDLDRGVVPGAWFREGDIKLVIK